MCRNPRTALSKDVLCKQPTMDRPVVGYRRWLYQVGQAGAAIADGVPVFSAAYSRFQEIGIPSTRVQGFGDMSSGFEHMAKGLACEQLPVIPAARVSFWRAWGITPDQQEALEGQYRELPVPLDCRPVMSVADNPGMHFYRDSYPC